MKSIKETVLDELFINKSRFITILAKANNKKEVDLLLDFYKNKFKDATHYCYAYILDNTSKYEDDGEPSGTAGKPILNVLENNNLTNVIAIVIRYFGGIKLGAGGLIRAYGKSVRTALKKTCIADLIPGYYVEIEFPYENTKTIDNLLRNVEIKKYFGNEIAYTFKIEKEKFELIESELKLKTVIHIKKSILLEV